MKRVIAFIFLVGIAILASLTLASSTKFIGKKFPGFLVFKNNSVGGFNQHYWPSYNEVKLFDRVISIDGKEVKNAADLYEEMEKHEVGAAITYDFQKPNQKILTKTFPILEFTQKDFILCFLIPFLGGIIFILLGFLAFFLKPKLAESFAFLIFSIVAGGYFILSFDFQTFHKFSQIEPIFFCFLPFSVFHLSLVLPRKLEFIKKYPIILWLLYVAATGFTIWSEFVFETNYKLWLINQYTLIVILMISYLEWLGILIYHSRVTTNVLDKVKAQIVLIGQSISFVFPFIFAFVIISFGYNLPFNFTILFCLIFPIFITYAIIKHNLFDIENIIKRSLVYSVLTALITLSYIFVVIKINDLLLKFNLAPFSLIFLVVLIFLFNPLRSKVQDYIDRVFYKKRVDYSKTLEEISKKLTSLNNLEEIAGELYKCFKHVMMLNDIHIFIREEREQEGDRFLDKIKDFKNEIIFKNDFYRLFSEKEIANLRPEVGLPLVFQERLLGLIVLGQKKSEESYSLEDFLLLKTLSNQAAIAVNNGDLIKNLENKVQERTKELREAQSQLVHAEKMSALGKLTAGIMHEVNNPINFISGNIGPLRHYLNSLFTVVESDDKEKVKNELDYNFIKEDYPKLLENMETGVERTKEIIKSLKSFSRLDEAKLKKVNIHEGIDSTLVIIGDLYKDRINIHKEYGDIPEIECFPSELNQVFMNILTNACNAITNNGDIWIKTYKEKNEIKISIKDSGVGIPQEIKNKIFDPFFTTKDVGEGVGMGLSISYGIVKRHNGEILVKSDVGKGTEFIIILPIK